MGSQYNNTGRASDFLDSLKQVVRIARQHKALVLAAGDLSDKNSLSGDTLWPLLDADAYANSQGVWLLAATGNHDMSDPPFSECLYRYKTSLLGAAAQGGLLCLDNRAQDYGGVSIYGLPFMPVQDMREKVKSLPPCDILMWHGALSEFIGYKSENVLSVEDFPPDKFGVVLIGDTHVRKVIAYGGTLFVSPGSTELCNKGEQFDKSVELLDIEPGQRGLTEESCLRRVMLDTRPVHAFRIMNNTDMVEVLGKVRALGQTRCMIFVSYNPEVADAGDRLRPEIDETKVILRCDTLAECVLPRLPIVSDNGVLTAVPTELVVADYEDALRIMTEERPLTPAEFLPSLLPDNEVLRALCSRILQDPTPKLTLLEWKESRLAELTGKQAVL